MSYSGPNPTKRSSRSSHRVTPAAAASSSSVASAGRPRPSTSAARATRLAPLLLLAATVLVARAVSSPAAPLLRTDGAPHTPNPQPQPRLLAPALVDLNKIDAKTAFAKLNSKQGWHRGETRMVSEYYPGGREQLMPLTAETARAVFHHGNQTLIRELLSGGLALDRFGRTVRDYLALDSIGERSEISAEEFFRDFHLPGRPLILRASAEKAPPPYVDVNHEAEERYNVGILPYPKSTGQNWCPGRYTFGDIIEAEPPITCPANNNASAYLLLKPCAPVRRALTIRDADDLSIPTGAAEGCKGEAVWDMFSEEPRFEALNRRIAGALHMVFDFESADTRVQFFAGPRNSGATLHAHRAAYNLLLEGEKRWLVTPPAYAGRSALSALEYFRQHEHEPTAFTFTQYAGDVVILPPLWGHATLNNAFSMGAGILYSPREMQREVMYVHVNKAGGTSIISALRASPCVYDGSSRNFHASAHRQRGSVGGRRWRNAFTFATVRNPWERQLSNWKFLMRRCSQKRTVRCERRFIPETPTLDVAIFHQWIRKLDSSYPVGARDEYLFSSYAHNNDEDSFFNSTQASWLVDREGTVLVDHLYRLDDPAFWSVVQLHNPCLERDSLPHLNPSATAAAAEDYFRPQDIREIMARHLQADFELYERLGAEQRGKRLY